MSGVLLDYGRGRPDGSTMIDAILGLMSGFGEQHVEKLGRLPADAIGGQLMEVSSSTKIKLLLSLFDLLLRRCGTRLWPPWLL